jgi:hypothetical protein
VRANGACQRWDRRLARQRGAERRHEPRRTGQRRGRCTWHRTTRTVARLRHVSGRRCRRSWSRCRGCRSRGWRSRSWRSRSRAGRNSCRWCRLGGLWEDSRWRGRRNRAQQRRVCRRARRRYRGRMCCTQQALSTVRARRHSGTAHHQNRRTHEECTHANHINLRFRIRGTSVRAPVTVTSGMLDAFALWGENGVEVVPAADKTARSGRLTFRRALRGRFEIVRRLARLSGPRSAFAVVHARRERCTGSRVS